MVEAAAIDEGRGSWADVPLDDPQVFANREWSWLDFNDRVLWEALDPRNPLLERIRFLAIAASNLDEFNSKRIGWLRLGLKQDPSHRTVDGLTIAEQFPLIQARCHEMQRAIDACWRDVLAPELAARGYRVVAMSDLDAAARAQLREQFLTSIFPVLTPLIVDPSHPFPFISGGSLSLILSVHPDQHHYYFARVKVPANRNRLIDAGDGRFVLIEDLIEAHLDELFPGVDISDVRLLRVLRSSEVWTPSEDAADLLEVMEDTLARRRMADAVLMELDGSLPVQHMTLLLEELGLAATDVYTGDGMLGVSDLQQLAALPLADETFPPFTPATPTAFARIDDDDLAFFASIRSQDVLVHHPYESFDSTVARLLQAAAADPQVLAIKHTTYRTSPDSPILAALIEAAARGKQVAVLVELAARFDEANNIEWARRLEDAGVHVAYGNPNQKIHAKISLIVREEPMGVTLYGHIGTGNYNSRTARVYTDLGLFTTDAAICEDLLHVFNHLTGLSTRLETGALLVAPGSLRQGIEERIRREIEHARAGRPARVVFKVNALEDARVCTLLYEAARAGVTVDLLIRGICRLRPGLPGLSDGVRVRSIIGRFLEHSRVYAFTNGGDPEVYIGSTDLMKRNLDERIEVITPVSNPGLQQQLQVMLEQLLTDRRQGWDLIDMTWHRDQTHSDRGVHDVLLGLAPFS